MRVPTVLETNGTHYVNAIDEEIHSTAIALGITIINAKTGDEKTLDLLAPDDRLTTVLPVITQLFPGYCFYESWEVEPLAPIEHQYAA
jgi:hypothetical protein